MEGDLRALSRFNIIFKYADDTNLLVPEHTDIDLATHVCHESLLSGLVA